MDVWHPGITQASSALKKADLTRLKKATLTCLCNTTGFASTGFLSQVDANTVTRAAFANFFVPNGIPKLILLDKGSEFKGVLVVLQEPWNQSPCGSPRTTRRHFMQAISSIS